MARRFVILGAGAPQVGSQSPLLHDVIKGRQLLELQLQTVGLEKDYVYLVTGFESERFEPYRDSVTVVENKRWKDSGSLMSLAIACEKIRNDDDATQELIVAYGDILFREEALESLREDSSDISVAWSSQSLLNQNFKPRSTTEKVAVVNGVLQSISTHIPEHSIDGFFVGLVRFSGDALHELFDFCNEPSRELQKATVGEFVEFLRCRGKIVDAIDLKGDWAEVGSEHDIVRFVLGTKAETLSRLRKLVSVSQIEDQVSFDVKNWQEDSKNILSLIKSQFSESLIVRSSARSEDSFTHSNAGAYTSLLHVDPNNGLEAAIEEVIASYHNQQPDDQVLVQPMLKNVIRSGVAFTRTLEHGAPYYVINYDETGSTDGITAGSNNEHKTLVIRRGAKPEQVANSELLPLLDAMREIEGLLSFDSLDIEFAMTEGNVVHILQVRPIAVQKAEVETSTDACYEVLDQAETLWIQLKRASAHLAGDEPIYGVMPDWNPAEIIGTNPGKLAETLYKYLIMDETWATQRAEYGYRDVRPQPLLVSFAGKPYVDVRASFNSFIPKNISEAEAHQLVNFYLSYLKSNPKLHDKVEFEVVPTCVGPAFYRWEERLQQKGGFDPELISKLKAGLLNVSRHAVENTKTYLSNVEKLQARISKRRKSKQAASIRNVRLLLDECRLHGTLPFAHLARSGFVAATILKEGVKEGWLTQAAMDDFMCSVRTVSHELTEDAKATAQGTMSWQDFVATYGHLRPGTYDITSPAYFDDPEKFLRPIVDAAMDANHAINEDDAWIKEKSGFFTKVRALGLDYTDELIEQFLRDGIEGREKAKFIFSRNLSEALDMMRILATEFGLTVEEWANLSLYDVLGLSESTLKTAEQKDFLLAEAFKNGRQRKLASTCELPALLTSLDDFYSFELSAGVPNYIGSKRVMARCVHLNGTEQGDLDVQGAVVLIPQADPGYDWLFGQGIAGLITMYGGANSHMAIRSAEFGLPAAIGIGEQLFKQLSQAQEIELDPANNVMRTLR
ncbi:PEP/pyruvate-binding domain-containing protein [Rheinheimera maricola]|uniref:Sugar metabolism cluster protein n=1 Tax=Rheinheimera maricola TaxID=2793282 RepID=A0ABS7X449_9GAMM|nr:PEP/pyruvate-binding domain-containing protein [Rheinheimera maricola]MBZ9610321.1 sugar metabolism cluster protein [Rheinheimera maricola]